jgi:small-conductance mechanosensitive channel
MQSMDTTAWLKAFRDQFADLFYQVATYLPRLLLAIAVMALGWLIARVARALCVRLLLGVDLLWQRFIAHKGLERLQPRYPPARIAGEILFWFVVLFFMAGAASILGLGTFVAWISKLTTYIPILLTGLLIIIAGIILSSLLRDLVASGAERAGIQRSDLLGRIVQITVLLTATAIGVDQIGINISFLSVVVGVALAATFGSVALAFGIGAQTYMSNVIAGHQLKQLYQIGDRLRIGGIEGTIIELSNTKVILGTTKGRVIIPAKMFEEAVAELPERVDRETQ